RVWQACVACRRKKIKCDGQQPCHNCSSREAPCDYPGSKDNASHSRNYAMAFETQCQQLDVFCRRLENLTGELHRSIETLKQQQGTDKDNATSASDVELNNSSILLRDDEDEDEEYDDDNDDDDDDNGIPQTLNDVDQGDSFGACAGTARFGSLVTDSYGRLRFVGGATNDMLIEAVKSLTPGHSDHEQAQAPSQRQPIEIPLFTHGQVWPELSLLPGPEKLSRPPQYVGDLLVGLYFDQLHYMLPVLYKPDFMARYRQMKASTTVDKRFLMVFFAICACASNLIPSDSGGSKTARFPGIDYYQKSLLLNFATTGEASLERVQCFALLAMCSAGWNTLSQSWTFAGQAVRAAQDLGMHLSNLAAPSSQHLSANRLKTEISRRVWWSLYCLDRVTSTCLGRPMAVNDADCHCALPQSADDEALHEVNQQESIAVARKKTTSSSMAGFVAFARLCHIAGKIQALHSPARIQELAMPQKARGLARLVARLDRSLDNWLGNLPEELGFSTSVANRGPTSAMSVVMSIVHAGSRLALYRSLGGKVDTAMLTVADPVHHCITAARSCINAAELLRELVPPSHHLAICIHYLTLSGIVLLRTTEHSDRCVAQDVDKCVAILRDLEAAWSGARKSRLILEQLMKEPISDSS
ncbi:Zn(II)2Cys6 transcription factor, partial [Microdochium trichocladiopsis]